MTMSEFGRTPFSNDSAGTDHGTANVQFVIGPNVRGGHYGQPSSFATINDQWDRFDMTTDFRNVLGTVHRRMDGRRGVDDPQRRVREPRVLPDRPWRSAAERRRSADDQSAVEPDGVRLDESRSGCSTLATAPAADSAPLGAGGIVAVRRFAVSTACPPRPSPLPSTSPRSMRPPPPTSRRGPVGRRARSTSNLNPVPGMAVPNLAIVRLGTAR